jgi:hypothetical protein
MTVGIFIVNRPGQAMLGVGTALAFGVPMLFKEISGPVRPEILTPWGIFIGAMVVFGIPILLRDMVRPNVVVMAGLMLCIGLALTLGVPTLLRKMSGTLQPNFLVTAAIVFVLDIAYRQLACNGHLLKARGGGQMYYIPLWVWAIVVFSVCLFFL